MARDCSCAKCVSACSITPGWFAPGEAEEAAKLLGVPFEEFSKRLIKNYMYDEYDDVKFWIPRKVGPEFNPSAELLSDRASNTKGRCTFLTEDNRCEIHAAKPMECREALLCNPTPDIRRDIVKMWEAPGVPRLEVNHD